MFYKHVAPLGLKTSLPVFPCVFSPYRYIFFTYHGLRFHMSPRWGFGEGCAAFL